MTQRGTFGMIQTVTNTTKFSVNMIVAMLITSMSSEIVSTGFTNVGLFDGG